VAHWSGERRGHHRQQRRGRGWLGLLRLLHTGRPAVGGVDRLDAGGSRLAGAGPSLGLHPRLQLDPRHEQRRLPRHPHHRRALRRLRPVGIRGGGMAGRLGGRPRRRHPQTARRPGRGLRPAGSTRPGRLLRPVRHHTAGRTGRAAARRATGRVRQAGKTGHRPTLSLRARGSTGTTAVSRRRQPAHSGGIHIGTISAPDGQAIGVNYGTVSQTRNSPGR
jgi:hypothetical protein